MVHAILRRLGYNIPPVEGQKASIPLKIRQCRSVAPIPRNKHPEYKARRIARARATCTKYKNDPNTCYVDASPYSLCSYWAGKGNTSSTVKTTSIGTAEEAAVAKDSHYND